MSIWSSILLPGETWDNGRLFNIPDRDNYDGRPEGTHLFSIDIATATSWNDTIRLVVEEEETQPERATIRYTQMQLTVDEANGLIARLQFAIDRIRSATEGA